MKLREDKVFVDGSVGAIELIVEDPGTPRGIALVCHPHPLFGGSSSNKVTQTLARTFARLDYLAVRPNFRGVGGSAGTHDHGYGESADMLSVLAAIKRRYGDLPVALAGFSFGAYVQTRVAQALAEIKQPAQGLVLVGTAAGLAAGERQYVLGAVASDTLVIHGSADETVPLANVLAWAEPLELPVVVIAGADHFFHRRLHIIGDIVTRAWRH
jgi:alpha/beta superfamily hydrolase